jgi:hypothetical protein
MSRELRLTYRALLKNPGDDEARLPHTVYEAIRRDEERRYGG